MAEGEGEARRAVDSADHWLLYAISITLMVVAISALAYWGFERLGWTGPASLFR